jgi:hypothetical protein
MPRLFTVSNNNKNGMVLNSSPLPVATVNYHYIHVLLSLLLFYYYYFLLVSIILFVYLYFLCHVRGVVP